MSWTQRQGIAAAAKELDDLRTAWLNPPEWTRTEILEFPGSPDGPWARYIVGRDSVASPLLSAGQQRSSESAVPAGQRGRATESRPTLVRYPRLVPKDDDCAKELKKRTLTNLYNQRPTWLDLAHQKLDAAVFAAYGWPVSLSDDDLLARLLALNLKRST
ncbi:MAG: hypothetical protein ACR2FY_05195 [Pirellulaceae bacterium]